MTRSSPRRVPVAILVLVLLWGGALVGYGLWTRPLTDADRAFVAGRPDEALTRYTAAEQRLARVGALRRVFAADHGRAMFNQLALLYHHGDLDRLLEKAAVAPVAAAPHFWAGSALLRRALAEDRAEAKLAWLTRAEAELKQALQASPDDWDAKFNYELAARLAADLRFRPGKTPAVQMQILRPQPRQGPPPRRTG